VRFLAATSVGLVGPLPLHGRPVCDPRRGRESRRGTAAQPQQISKVVSRVDDDCVGPHRQGENCNGTFCSHRVSTRAAAFLPSNVLGQGLCATVRGSPREVRRCHAAVGSVSSPRFPQLWKTLWKNGLMAEFSWKFDDFSALGSRRNPVERAPASSFIAVISTLHRKPCSFRRRKSASCSVFGVVRNEREHLGSDPHADRKQS
jgi:hypothetical protein